LSKDTRIDFIGNPDLITVEANAVIAALEYWKNNNLNKC
jgi:predicted chitinase